MQKNLDWLAKKGFIKLMIKDYKINVILTPEGQELEELFSRANLRAGAIMSLVGKAGLRPEVLGNHNATDGFMIKDLPDLVVEEDLNTFVSKPPRIVVRKTLSKTNHEYYTFLTDLGAKRLLAYLNERLVS